MIYTMHVYMLCTLCTSCTKHATFLFFCFAEIMAADQQHLRHCLLFLFDSGMNGVEAHRRLVEVYGPDVISQRTCYNWFDRFREGDRSLQDESRSGRPPELDLEELRRLVEADPKQTARDLATILSTTHTTILHGLHSLGKVQKLHAWLPHVLTDNDKKRRMETCAHLLSWKRNKAWLNNVITCDEKWVCYSNVLRRHQWVNAEEQAQPEHKGELHEKKNLLCVWWGIHGIVHWELTPDNTTINADIYCTQLQRVKQKLDFATVQQDKVYLLQDNARPHVAKKTYELLLSFGWMTLPHPPYSPDLSPSDYHLFRSLQNHLDGKNFANRKLLETDLKHFFESKPPEFYITGINELPDRWRKVIAMDGEYIVD